MTCPGSNRSSDTTVTRSPRPGHMARAVCPSQPGGGSSGPSPSRHSQAHGTEPALFHSLSIGQIFNVACWALGFPFLFLPLFPRVFQGDTTYSSLCPSRSAVLGISWSFLWRCSGRRGSSISLPAPFRAVLLLLPRASSTHSRRAQRLPLPCPGPRCQHGAVRAPGQLTPEPSHQKPSPGLGALLLPEHRQGYPRAQPAVPGGG